MFVHNIFRDFRAAFRGKRSLLLPAPAILDRSAAQWDRFHRRAYAAGEQAMAALQTGRPAILRSA